MTSSIPVTTPISACISSWHAHMRGTLDGGLDALLHIDCVFYSPIVFTPQVGREITKLYLTAASHSLAGAPLEGAPKEVAHGAPNNSGKFRYTKQILSTNEAMLEFETSIQGKYINGVDIITCDDAGLITEFRVMIRPLQAVNLVHAQMKAMIETLA